LFVWSYSSVFSECSLAAELVSLTPDIHESLKQRPPPPKQERDHFHCQLNSGTSASKNVKRIYMFDANGQRRKTRYMAFTLFVLQYNRVHSFI